MNIDKDGEKYNKIFVNMYKTCLVPHNYHNTKVTVNEKIIL